MSQSVRPINMQIIGMTSPTNLINQTIPAITVIDVSTFRAGDVTNELTFQTASQTTGRLGIFAAEKDGIERAVRKMMGMSLVSGSAFSALQISKPLISGSMTSRRTRPG